MRQLGDLYCLCGGSGFLFSSILRLDGGPVVVGKGYVHKAKDGYKVSIQGKQSDIPLSVVEEAKDLFRQLAQVSAISFMAASRCKTSVLLMRFISIGGTSRIAVCLTFSV